MKTVSLQLSKELKEAGYPQESNYSWIKVTRDINGNSHDWQFHDEKDLGVPRMFEKEGRAEIIASPTADEILENIPFFITNKDDHSFLRIKKLKDTYKLLYVGTKEIDYKRFEIDMNTPISAIIRRIDQETKPEWNDEVYYELESNNLADAAAKMWLYLKKEKLI